jgi:TIR domain
MPEAEGGGIFVSYRRQESSGITGRLYDRLATRFGHDQVFMDVDKIAPGADFAEVIDQAVSSCAVLLAIIGPGWLTATDEDGRQRLDNPDDLVRVEIRTALERNILVIPILVEGAVMPSPKRLPEGLVGLARRNARSVRHENFGSDADRLLAAIERVLATAPGTAAVSAGPPARGVGSARDAAGGVAQKDVDPVRNDSSRAAMRSQTDAADRLSRLADIRDGRVIPAKEFEGDTAKILASGEPQTKADQLREYLSEHASHGTQENPEDPPSEPSDP